MSANAKRISAIVHQLCRMSRDGWRHARPCDYQPLERELAELQARRARRAPHHPTRSVPSRKIYSRKGGWQC